MKTRDITVIGIMTAISVVISIIESYFTFISDFIPGLKLGLSNIVIIYVLYKYDIFFQVRCIVVSSFPCNKLIYIVYFICNCSDPGRFAFKRVSPSCRNESF